MSDHSMERPKAMIESWNPEHLEAFERDGFLIVDEGFIDAGAIEVLQERFDRLFALEYETGIRPDEVNWVAGRDPEDRTRQICNGWKADTAKRSPTTKSCVSSRSR